ncbi:hypothetical protein BFW01_g2698 [Lasiodiplodia theobromae]|nr:uncharacterized protein LTHEOB_5596 [Lasiodiplodia theobromae]KAF4545185.1 hypothetical protein LTHEOB_5596 [Lasiodiplodia theobromae]KAF9631836.1 hypothetical protein BFW01_g2698 [Lasiodiplodia theobromae]
MAYRRTSTICDPCLDVCGPNFVMVCTLICSYLAMAICIPWLCFWLFLRSIVWVLTCGHYGFNFLEKKREENEASNLAVAQSLAQLGDFLNPANHPGTAEYNNNIDLEAQDTIQPAARSNTYHELLAEIQTKPQKSENAILLEALPFQGRGNYDGYLTEEEKKAAKAEAKRMEEEKKALKEAQRTEGFWVWQNDKA